MAFTLSMKKNVYWVYHFLIYWKQRRLHAKNRVSLPNRIRMFKHGFETDSYVRYELDKNDFREYVSDFERWVRTPLINHDYRILLNDKHVFHILLERYSNILPRFYGVIKNGKYRKQENQGTYTELEDILSSCEQAGSLVIKPTMGTCGRGVLILRSKQGQFILNGKETSREQVIEELKAQSYSLVTEFVEQCDFTKQFHPKTTNTVRVLSMYDEETQQAFIATAVLRIGTKSTGAVDNWAQGGLSVPIACLETGRLGPAVSYRHGQELRRFSNHPDTGVEIEGMVIPNWPEISQQLLALANEISYLPYVGWDLILTKDGFKIIEGNTESDLDVFQVHGPLLANPQVKEFYRYHDVIRR